MAACFSFFFVKAFLPSGLSVITCCSGVHAILVDVIEPVGEWKVEKGEEEHFRKDIGYLFLLTHFDKSKVCFVERHS